jgi:hypothetical protein
MAETSRSDRDDSASVAASIGGGTTFIGDYFGNTVGAQAGGAVDYASFVSTYDDGTDSAHYQQQIVAAVAVP